MFIPTIAVWWLTELLARHPGPFNVIQRSQRWLRKLHPEIDKAYACPYCLSGYPAILVALLSMSKYTRWIVYALAAWGGFSLLHQQHTMLKQASNRREPVSMPLVGDDVRLKAGGKIGKIVGVDNRGQMDNRLFGYKVKTSDGVIDTGLSDLIPLPRLMPGQLVNARKDYQGAKNVAIRQGTPGVIVSVQNENATLNERIFTVRFGPHEAKIAGTQLV